MSDEQAPEVETPAADDTSAVVEQPAVDYKGRYDDLRPEFDRRSQELSQYRQALEGLSSSDVHTRQKAADDLGLDIEFVADTDNDTFEDPRDREFAEMKRQLEGLTANQREAQERAQVEQAAALTGQKLAALGVDQETADLVFAKSLTLPKTPDGLPDIEAAHEAVTAYENAAKQRWAQTKRSPRVSAVGTSGTQAPDLDDDEQRVAHMIAQYRDLTES